MKRREFLNSLQAQKASQEFNNIELSNSGLTPYTGVWDVLQISHLLKRTMFGAKKADVDYFKTKSMNAAVDELITTVNTPPLPPVNNYADPDVPAGETWVNAAYSSSGTVTGNRINSLHSWWTGLQLNQNRSIEEKMVLFWHNHLVTEHSGLDPRHLYRYNVVLRKNALGNFKTMIKDITLTPAMLVYLNGNKNTAGAPNENYGRELQELFTMGKGPNSKYTESDVQAAAKVLTGYDIDSATLNYVFKSTKHDITNKQFSAFYNNTLITGRSGTAGEQELDDLITMLFNQTELSLFICRKLYRFFVYYTIDQNIETNIIEPLATIFRNNNFDIKPVLQALFKSEHFYDALNIGCLIKSPIDFVVGICREFDVVFPGTTSFYVETYALWRVLITSALDLSQELGNPPDVAGWPAYYQEPQFHQLWINSNSLPRRNLFSDTIISAGFTKSGKKIVIDPIAYVAKLNNPSDPNELISESLMNLFMINISQESKNYLKTQFLLSGQSTDSYWTTAWANYISSPTNTTYKNVVFTRLQPLFKYLMALSEFQLS
jgi:uncharacterized protein (DUF1800 family)